MTGLRVASGVMVSSVIVMGGVTPIIANLDHGVSYVVSQRAAID